jgi:hypothetical protein
MRNLFLFLFACCCLAVPAGAGESKPNFINAKVSSRQVALNQTVRIEFTTMPRQVDNLDIGVAITNAIRLSGSGCWRLMGNPVVSEHEKTKTVTVTVSLLPRIVGDLPLPEIPLLWLQGNQVARFDLIVVTPTIQVGGNTKELPKEVFGIAGFGWGAKLSESKDKFTAEQIQTVGERTSVRVQPNLTLEFSGGVLAQATLIAPGLALEQARDSFLERWGLPQQEDGGAVIWVLGWTRITATANQNPAGLKLDLVREDILSNLNKGKVDNQVFDVLNGANAPPETPEQAAERKRKEAEREVGKPVVPVPEK